jgi:RecJ-like exonuclease
MDNTQHTGSLCYACKFDEIDGKIITCDMSECEICNNQITSGSYTLCIECSTKQERCYECGNSINFDESELDNKLLELVNKKNELCDQWTRISNRMTNEKLKESTMTYANSFHEKCNTAYVGIELDLKNGKRNFI